MLYGRRKTGKTFLVQHFVEHDRFYFVNRDGTILDLTSGKYMNYDEFRKEFLDHLGKEKIIIDEFHRLPDGFLDLLHAYSTLESELILITSTLWLAVRILSMRESPLLNGTELIEASMCLECPH